MIVIEELEAPVRYRRVSGCETLITQFPWAIGTNSFLELSEQIEEGPTDIEIGVLVFEEVHSFWGSSVVNIAVAGISSGF